MLIIFNLKETRADSCVFISTTKDHLLRVDIIVDGGLRAATNNKLVDDLIRYYKDNFKTKDSDLNQFLGIEIDQSIDGYN